MAAGAFMGGKYKEWEVSKPLSRQINSAVAYPLAPLGPPLCAHLVTHLSSAVLFLSRLSFRDMCAVVHQAYERQALEEVEQVSRLYSKRLNSPHAVQDFAKRAGMLRRTQ